jgi:hypothetical protein
MTSLVLAHLVARIRSLHRDLTARRDDGYTTETIAVIAMLVALAIAVLAVVAAKVLAKAQSIDLNG